MSELSVIVCTYNTQPEYLECCFESIARGGLSDYEIVLIDDGSDTDYSAVCEKYPAVRHIVIPRSGTLLARLAGIRESRGKFISFADSDDTVSFSFYARLLEKMRQGSDIAVGGWAFHSPTCRYVCVKDSTMQVRAELCGDILPFFFEEAGKEHSRYVLWNKMFTADVLRRAAKRVEEELPDFPLCYAEDVLLSRFVLGEAKSLSFVQGGYYFYRTHAGQTVKIGSEEKLLYTVKCADYVFDRLKKADIPEGYTQKLGEWQARLDAHFLKSAQEFSEQAVSAAENFRSKSGFAVGKKVAFNDKYLIHRLLPDNFEEYEKILSEIQKNKKANLICKTRTHYFENELARLKENGVPVRKVKNGGIFVPKEKYSLKNRIKHNPFLCRIAGRLFPPGSKIREKLKKIL